MADIKGDPTKQPTECRIRDGGACPHIKEDGGGIQGERYRCAVCGESYFLDYDDMR